MNKRLLYKIEKRIMGLWKKIIYSGHIKGTGQLLCDRNCILDFGRNSSLEIEGSLTLSDASYFNNRRSSIIIVKQNGRFITRNGCVYYGASIKINDNAEFIIGKSFINADCKIDCSRKIVIGNDVAISYDFCAMDSNAHELNGKRKTAEIHICDHVWIGSRVTVLPGVTIGEGAVVASNTLVNKDVPPHTLVGGIPAKILKENVDWKG